MKIKELKPKVKVFFEIGGGSDRTRKNVKRQQSEKQTAGLMVIN